MQIQTTTERTSGAYSCVLKDAAGAFPTLTALTLSLIHLPTEAAINARDKQSILNVNNGTYAPATGVVTWLPQPADMAIVGTGGQTYETHRAIFQATWTGGGKTWYVDFRVENLQTIT